MPAANAPSTIATNGDEATARPLRARITSHLGIDPRALGAFRIGLGLVILFDLLVLRASGLETFYTDDGVLPRAALADTSPTLAQWSLHAISGSLWVQALLLGLTVILAVCLLVGYRPRLAAVGTAVLLASLYARNPYLVNGGDTILISVLFLATFLPLDARWSLRSHRQDDSRHLSVATATILLHVVVIYAINAILKFQSDPWTSGVAVRRIFHLEDFVYLFGPTLAEYPAVLTGISWLWTAVLSASVLLVVATGYLRIAIVAAFVGAHLSMATTMRLGAFPFVMCAVLLLFLPPQVWAFVDRLVTESGVSSPLAPVLLETDDPKPSAGRSLLVRRGLRVATAGLLVCVLVGLVGWQITAAGLVETPSSGADSRLEGASWAFFAPNPPDSYSWYVVEAEYESGKSIDLVDGGEVSFDRPPNAMDRYPTTLWKRYGTKTQGAGAVAQPAAAYFCEQTSTDVESVTIYQVDQSVDADGPVGEPVPQQRSAVTCG